MLSLGPGSTCDVCLEPFGPDTKSPHSIQCGHVFCLACLNHLTRLLCPLCRNEFEARDFIKLRIEVDNSRSSPRANSDTPHGSPEAEAEARRLQEAIAGVANVGSTEPRLRQLIEECRTFLASQPRTLFQNLRVSHRMIAYLCEVKSRLRAQNQAVDRLNEQLEEVGKEKAVLEQTIEQLVEKNKDEKETALAVEKSLREHCTRANAAYEILEDRYKSLTSEWEKLNEEVKRLRLGSLSLESDSPERPVDISPIQPVVNCPPPTCLLPASSDQFLNLKGLGVDDQESWLISPLPQFTDRLPLSSLESFSALPEVTDESEQIKDGSPHINVSNPSCDASDHPLSCACISFPVLPESVQPTSYDNQTNAAAFPDPSIPEPIINIQPSSPIVIADVVPVQSADSPRPPSGLSLTAPRACNLSGQSLQRPRSFSAHLSTQSPSRPSSTSLQPTSAIVHDQYASRESGTPSSHLNIPIGRNTEHMRSRLHDILRDPTSPVSSSLPIISTTHFHSPDTRDARHHDDISHPSPLSTSSRSVSARTSTNPPTIHPPQPVPINNTSVHSKSSATTTAISNSHNSVPQRAPISHASSAALALERAQRAEKERQRAEREQGRDRRNSEKEHEVDRSRTLQTPSIPRSPSSYLSSQAKPIYALSGSASSSVSGPRREMSSFRSTTSLRDTTNAITQQQRYAASASKSKISTHLTSGMAGVYA